MSGWIKLHRGWRECPALRGPSSRKDAWVWLIEKACFKPTPFDVNGKTITLQPGQLCASRSQMAEAWDWSESAVERFLARLIADDMITRETGKHPKETRSKTGQTTGRTTGQGRSVITICNYVKYQELVTETGQATGQATGQRSDSDRTTKEEGKKERLLEGRKEGSARESDAPAKPLSDEVPLDHHDTLAIAQECARAGGVRFIDPGHISTGVELIRQWQQAGADPPLMLATIRSVISTTKQTRIGSLRFFDDAIRKAIAQREAERHGTPLHRTRRDAEPSFSELALAELNRLKSSGQAGLGGGGDAEPRRLAGIAPGDPGGT